MCHEQQKGPNLLQNEENQSGTAFSGRRREKESSPFFYDAEIARPILRRSYLREGSPEKYYADVSKKRPP
jgi:hypothetical protein